MKPNLKNFIVAFLAIAILTSSSVFATSAFFERRSKSSATGSASGGARNGFVEQLPERQIDPALALLRSPKGPNATDEIAKLLAKEIVEENPEGPLERNGKPTILLPTSTESIIADYLKNKPEPIDLLRSPVKTERIKKVADSKESVASYLNALDGLANSFVVPAEPSTDVQFEAWLRKNEEVLFGATRQLYAIETPASLIAFHESLIGAVATPAEYSSLMVNDPVTAAAMQATFEQAAGRRVLELEIEAKALQHSEISLLFPTEQSLIARFLGVNTAYAQITDFAALAQRITIIFNQVKDYVLKYSEKVEKIAIGYLKNVLLKKLADQTVKWILGEGTPQFVTNWESFARNAFNDAAGAVIAEVAPALCGSGGAGFGAELGLGHIGDLIRKILTPPEIIDYSYYTGCTLDQVVRNFEDFQRDLRNGGWLAYSALFEPQNTFFGSLVQVREIQRQKAAKAEGAEKSKAESGDGFIGQMACDDGKQPLTQPLKIYAPIGGMLIKELPAGSCADGSTPHVVTPGRFAADAISDSLSSVYPRIASANEYAPLAAVLIDAAITRLFKEAQKGLFSYASGGGNGTGIDDEREQPKSDVAGQARQILEKKSQSLSDARSAQAALEQTINILIQVQNICGSDEEIAAAAAAIIEAIDPLGDDLGPKVERLKVQVPALEQFISDISKNNSTLAQLQSRFGDFFAAQAETKDIAEKRAKIETAYLSASQLFSSCSDGALNAPIGGTSTSTPPEDDGTDP